MNTTHSDFEDLEHVPLTRFTKRGKSYKARRPKRPHARRPLPNRNFARWADDWDDAEVGDRSY